MVLCFVCCCCLNLFECFDYDILCDVVWCVVVSLLLRLCVFFACASVVIAVGFVCCFMACLCVVFCCG